MSRVRYIGYRTLHTVFLLWFILTFLFVFFRLMPGSYIDLMVYQGASQETIAQFEERWGLNDPLYVQYYTYLMNLLTGDAGHSLSQRMPVWEFVRIRLFNSLILVAPAVLTGYVLATIIGTILGNARGSRIEKYGVLGIITIGSIPSFFLGIIMIAIFAVGLGLFPTGGMLSPGVSTIYADEPWWRMYLTQNFLWHYALPFLTIAIRYIYSPSIVMRTSVVEVSDQAFNYYHKITGLPYRKRMRRLGRHAILPVITLFPISMAQAISGLVLVEVVFNWPGIGLTLVEAIFVRDTPVIQFIFFLAAAFVVISNFVIDIVYTIIDPRVTVEE